MKLALVLAFYAGAKYFLVIVFTISEKTRGWKRVPDFGSKQFNIGKTTKMAIKLEYLRIEEQPLVSLLVDNINIRVIGKYSADKVAFFEAIVGRFCSIDSFCIKKKERPYCQGNNCKKDDFFHIFLVRIN